jgi:hypothetical protein
MLCWCCWSPAPPRSGAAAEIGLSNWNGGAFGESSEIDPPGAAS